MQIRELVLYGYNGKVRHLKFKLGQVNIVTGKSKSGKSAIGDIIEYCLGGDSCNIADGVVRDNVAWYGLLLQFDTERVFVARKNPDNGKQTTNYCYIDIGENIEVPDDCNFISNTNVAGVEESLTRRIRISENLNIPIDGQSRPPLEANIRHALYYCFQNQGEIAAKDFLFHRQSEDFITLSIKDTILYFLGAINEDALRLEQKRRLLKRELMAKKRKIEETRALIGNRSERLISLIAEAQQVGCIDKSIQIGKMTSEKIFTVLKDIVNINPNTISDDMDIKKLILLQEKLQSVREEADNINIKLTEMKNFINDIKGYSTEAQHQKMHLESIGLFEKLNFHPNRCPFCSGLLEQALPGVDMIKKAIYDLDRSIKNVAREQPKIEVVICKLESEYMEKRKTIKTIKAEIEGLYRQKKEMSSLRDINIQKGKVIGKISFWLDSVETDTTLEKQELDIKSIQDSIKEIDDIIDIVAVEERKQSILSRIQENMTKWAQVLQLEHSDNPYRLDLNKVTVIIDKQDRSVTLKQLGSGANWVGVHLIAYFALQYVFVNANRPVPRFLFLDQPSQVYFPSEFDEKKIDEVEVNKMYKFIIDRTKKLDGKLQVIIVDHAETQFKDFICENWWEDDKNLVPKDWYTNSLQ